MEKNIVGTKKPKSIDEITTEWLAKREELQKRLNDVLQKAVDLTEKSNKLTESLLHTDALLTNIDDIDNKEFFKECDELLKSSTDN